jgi:hypothetical protein
VSTAAVAEALLAELPGGGTSVCASARLASAEEPPAAGWARSGALALTGHPNGLPVLPTAPLPTVAAGVCAALASLAPGSDLEACDGPTLLGEHAAWLGLGRRGRIAPGGHCRLVRARDGWLAVSLPRGPEDARLLPAWLGVSPGQDLWATLENAVRERNRGEVVARGRLLGLPVAPADAVPDPAVGAWLHAREVGEPAVGGVASRPLALRVADLSSLWAGPLCGRLLAQAGARVTKIESTTRPDGLRRGSPGLYRALNGAKAALGIDFTTAAGRAALGEALASSDVVLESARPRALAQLGVDAEGWLAERPGRIWVSITGYGRPEPAGHWVALGDDAAAAAGLCFCVPAGEAPLFVGDAIADPLTGLHAAAAVLASQRAGGGALLDVRLAGVVAHAIGWSTRIPVEGRVMRHTGGVVVCHPEGETRIASPSPA